MACQSELRQYRPKGHGLFLDLCAEESAAILDCRGSLDRTYRDSGLAHDAIHIDRLFVSFPNHADRGIPPALADRRSCVGLRGPSGVVQRTSFGRSHHEVANGFCWMCWNGALYL